MIFPSSNYFVLTWAVFQVRRLILMRTLQWFSLELIDGQWMDGDGKIIIWMRRTKEHAHWNTSQCRWCIDCRTNERLFWFFPLCGQVIRALQRQRRTETQWGNLVGKIINLEDVHRNMGSHERYFKPTFEVKRPSWQAWIHSPVLGFISFYTNADEPASKPNESPSKRCQRSTSIPSWMLDEMPWSSLVVFGCLFHYI